MSRDRYSVSYTHASTSRPLIGRGFVALLAIVCLVLLVLTRGHSPFATALRSHLLDTISPAVEWLSQPVVGVRSLVRKKGEFFNAYSENERLRAENDALRHWQEVAQSLKAENDALRALAGYQPVNDVSYITARVVGQSPSGYSSTLTLNAGSAEGIKPFQPVIDAFGLIGRVTEVGEHTSRVLLLSDSGSRIPVVAANARMHGILAGTGTSDEMLHMTFLGGNGTSVALGEQIVTTEEGGLIPGGIAVGTVFRRDANELLIQPVRPFGQSEYVRVIVVKQ
jgi:rod shape-determining protein MreC